MHASRWNVWRVYHSNRTMITSLFWEFHWWLVLIKLSTLNLLRGVTTEISCEVKNRTDSVELQQVFLLLLFREVEESSVSNMNMFNRRFTQTDWFNSFMHNHIIQNKQLTFGEELSWRSWDRENTKFFFGKLQTQKLGLKNRENK